MSNEHNEVATSLSTSETGSVTKGWHEARRGMNNEEKHDYHESKDEDEEQV